MSKQLIRELLINVKQKGIRALSNDLAKINDHMDLAVDYADLLNESLRRVPTSLQKIKAQAEGLSKSMSKIQVNIKVDGGVIDILQSINKNALATANNVADSADLMDHKFEELTDTVLSLEYAMGRGSRSSNRLGQELIGLGNEATRYNAKLARSEEQQKRMTKAVADSNRQHKSQTKSFADVAFASNPLVMAYASIAASVYAAKAAYTLLNDAASRSLLKESLADLGATTGRDIRSLSQDLMEASENTISLGEATKIAAVGSGYGFTNKQLEELTVVAKRASIVYGTDMTEAMNRATKGIAKLEVEILDEIGVTTTLTQAKQNYITTLQMEGKMLGRNVDSLSSYESQLALTNEVIRQSHNKLGGLKETTTDFQRVAAAVSTATEKLIEYTAAAAMYSGKKAQKFTFAGNIISGFQMLKKAEEPVLALENSLKVLTTTMSNSQTGLTATTSRLTALADTTEKLKVVKPETIKSIERYIEINKRVDELLNRKGGGGAVYHKYEIQRLKEEKLAIVGYGDAFERVARVWKEFSETKAKFYAAQGTSPDNLSSDAAQALAGFDKGIEENYKALNQFKQEGSEKSDFDPLVSNLQMVVNELERLKEAQENNIISMGDYVIASNKVKDSMQGFGFVVPLFKSGLDTVKMLLDQSKLATEAMRGLSDAMAIAGANSTLVGASQSQTYGAQIDTITQVMDTLSGLAGQETRLAELASQRLGIFQSLRVAVQEESRTAATLLIEDKLALDLENNRLETAASSVRLQIAAKEAIIKSADAMKGLTEAQIGRLIQDHEILKAQLESAKLRDLEVERTKEIAIYTDKLNESNIDSSLIAMSLGKTRMQAYDIEKALLDNNREQLLVFQQTAEVMDKEKEVSDLLNANAQRRLSIEQEITDSIKSRGQAQWAGALGDLGSTFAGGSDLSSGFSGMMGMLDELQAMDFATIGQGFSDLFNGVASTSGDMAQSVAASVGMAGQMMSGLLQMSAQNSMNSIDQAINLEKKRDGKSKESLQKIKALEAQKVNEQRKSAKKQIAIQTAVAIMMAAANPWPVPAIPMMAAAAAMGMAALGMANSGTIGGVDSGADFGAPTLKIGERDSSVDVSSAATQGELQYNRGERGIGSLGTFTPKAVGGEGYAGVGITVGENGPETYIPKFPGTVVSNSDSAQQAPSTSNVNVTIHAVDAPSVARLLRDNSDAVGAAWGTAVSAQGGNFQNFYR